MFKAIGFVIKVILFSTAVLVLGNWIHWRGRTLSDQVKIGVAHAEKSDWVGEVKGLTSRWTKKETGAIAEEITSSERLKLKGLIRELNGNSRNQDRD